MDNGSNKIFFLILFMGAVWLLFDLYYGHRYLKNAAISTTALIKGA